MNIIYIGAGRTLNVINEIVLKSCFEYNVVGILDDDASLIGTTVNSYDVIDTISNAKKYINEVDEYIMCVGATKDTVNRRRIYNQLRDMHITPKGVISDKSIISLTATVDTTSTIMPGVIINSNSIVWSNCLINTGAIIEHDCKIEPHSFISPGAVLCGNVRIGTGSFIGANSTIIGNLTIGNNCIVGAGSVVTKDVPDNTMVYGNPAKIITGW